MAKETTKKAKAATKTTTEEGGMIYFLGLIGALIYFVQAANGFWEIVLGALQAIVWPAYIAYKLLESFYGTVN